MAIHAAKYFIYWFKGIEGKKTIWQRASHRSVEEIDSYYWLVQPVWLWEFAEIRNRKEAESGLIIDHKCTSWKRAKNSVMGRPPHPHNSGSAWKKLFSLEILQPNISHLRDAPRKCGGKEEDKAEKYQKFLRKNPSLQGRIDSIVFSVLQCLIFCYHALAVLSLVCLPDDDVFFIM